MNKYYLKNGRMPTTMESVAEKEPVPDDMTLMYADGVSDGYHTMDELYEHRIRLFLALVKIYDNYETPLKVNVKCWKAHHYEGWFLLGMSCTKFNFIGPPTQFDISYHVPEKYWDLAKVIELVEPPAYDGYTSDDVLERLLRL